MADLTGATSSERLPFFVYGTLRTGEYNWKIYLEGRTAQELPARLSGHRLYAADYPIILEEGDETAQITGNLIYLDPAAYYDRILANLDDLEQYDPVTDSGLYRRVIREVTLLDEQGQPAGRVRAWVYQGHRPSWEATGYQLVQSGDWLNR